MHIQIFDEVETNINKSGCFVAGTLVHTQDGLKPIEQIKVGDYVLSKPESGAGEASYKRVAKTFEYENKEVWLIAYDVMSSDSKALYSEYVVVTGSHPFWVSGLEISGAVEPLGAWVKAQNLLAQYAEHAEYPIFELEDGRSAIFGLSGPILGMANPSQGLVYSKDKFDGSGKGLLVDFSTGHPEIQVNENGRYLSVAMDLPAIEDYPDNDSIFSQTGGFYPLLRKVYDLEVEENHTYYVGAAGVLVHDMSG